MNEQKLSERMRRHWPPGDLDGAGWIEGEEDRVHSWADEVADLEAKLEAIERAAFKLHEGVERFTVTNAELSDEMYILRQAIGYGRMYQLRAAAQEEEGHGLDKR